MHKNRTRAPLKPLDVATLALSVGGLGFLRPAPGTWGSVPPAVLAGLLMIGATTATVQLIVTGIVLVMASIVCVAWGRYAEKRFGRKDAPEVVADETAGVAVPILVACLFPGTLVLMLVQVAAAFVLFRVMDIIKPWPARGLERLPFGWGVLLDDLMAGVYAGAVLGVGLLLLR